SEIQLRKRIGCCRLVEEVMRFGMVSLGLIGLAQTKQILWILLVGLLQFINGLVVVLLGKGDAAHQLMPLLHLQWVVAGFGGLAEFRRMHFCAGEISLPN